MTERNIKIRREVLFHSGKDLFFCLHSGGYMEYFHTFVWANLQLSDWEQSVNRTYNTLINNK